MDKYKVIHAQLVDVLALPYQYGEWAGDVTYPYYVGEMTETPILTEDGREESTLFVTGTHRGKYIDLETDKEKIKQHFNPITGYCAKTDSGSIAVFYEGAFPVPTGEADLKRMQINLKIIEWKGNR